MEIPGEVVRSLEGAEAAEAAVLSVVGIKSGKLSFQTIVRGWNWWPFRRAIVPHRAQCFWGT